MFRLRRAQAGAGDKTPLDIVGQSGRGVLCLHGFSGTPFEVRPLGEALGRRGFSVIAPALAGHCGTVDELGATRWPDWLDSAMAALDRLLDRGHGAPVGVAGFSLGGLLALKLARLRPQHVAALTVMSAPLRLRPAQVAAIRAMDHLPAFLRQGPLRNYPKLGGYDVSDEGMQTMNPSLTAMPFAGLNSMLDLATAVRRELPSIKVPILVAHGHLDRTVPLEDSLELVGTVGSDVVERLWLQRSAHLIAIDVERTTVADAVTRFFTTHVGAAEARQAAP